MNSRSTTNQVAKSRPNLWAAGISVSLLSLSLILAACGDTSAPAAEPTTAAPAAPAATEAVETPESEEAEATPEAEATVAGSEEMTGTEETTDTEEMTGTEEATGTEDATPEVEATVTGSEEITGTEEATGTEDATPEAEATVTGSEEMTGTEGMDDSESMTETGATDSSATAAGTAGAAAAMMGVSGVDGEYMRASTLLDYDFENMDGEVSGDLEDLLIDLSTGRVLFASIEYGGILDLGDKDIVVPLNAFAMGPEGQLVLNIDETALESYPDVGNDWPDLNDPVWDDDVATFWNDTGIESGLNFEEPTTSVAWASDLMDHQVADLGAGAGSVLDILVDLEAGYAPYLIVDYGEGLDTDPYILPLSAYDVTTWEEELVYGPDFTPDILESAPRFDQDAYPEGTPLDREFGDGIESAWNDLGFTHDLNNDGEID